MNAVLMRKDFIDLESLQTRGDKVADEIGDHERDDHGVIARDFEDHDDGGHRRADDSGKCGAHTDKRVGALRGDTVRKQMMGNISDGTTEHGSHKETRAEYAAGVSRGIADDDRN